MDPIYVTGHRNPDTDSIVAAMAYAAQVSNLGLVVDPAVLPVPRGEAGLRTDISR